ncbi:hypothetical protein [Streptomyces sp. NPDC008139]|uniref:hypothetical protein n=1 Tax=Streptomyces sp. NPDC008139 TaxID=3364814 RepID=UPI0036E2E179
MALQAANLRHGKRSLELADSAAEAAPKAGPRLQAFLAGQQAQGVALVNDRRLAFSRLAETQAALSKADNRRDAIGGHDQAAYFFHVSSVLHAPGDVAGSIEAMQDSNRVRPPVEKQGRAHANGLLAQRRLEVGHLEASCATWSKFLDELPPHERQQTSALITESSWQYLGLGYSPGEQLLAATVREENALARQIAREGEES